LDELARVTTPGGFVLASFDNATRLFRLTDPRRSPLTAPVRRAVRRLRGRPLRGNRLTTPPRAHEMVEAAGLRVEKTCGVGFGPPTLLGRQVVSEPSAKSIDAALQRRADAGADWLSQRGVHYLVLARR
jgi:hypothetical protein